MARLRVMFLSSAIAGRSGVSNVVPIVVNELQRRGHRVSTALAGPSEHRAWEEALTNIYIGPQKPSGHGLLGSPVSIARWLSDILQREQPSVVVAMNVQAIGLAKYAQVVTRRRFAIVSWLHQNLNYVRHPSLLQWCDGHLAISSGIADQIRGIVGSHAAVSICSNPVNVTVPVHERPENGIPKFLFIGRLDNHQKRIDRILRALSQLRDLPWLLTVVGDGWDKAMLQQMALELDVADRITWTGWLNDPWSQVESATALLLTSDFEGFPMVLLEALARGIPAIAWDCPHGPRDIVRTNVNGWLVQDDSDLKTVLQDLASGKACLPAAAAVVDSVRPFALDSVIATIETALNEAARGTDRSMAGIL